MFYLIFLCIFQSLYILPLWHPFIIISLLYVYDIFYLSLWKLLLSFFLIIPYQTISLCFYHRYFSHKSFTTSRIVQFIFGWIACVFYQGGPIWWASVHRKHHKKCATIDDPHSPRNGFYYSFIAWPFFETKIYKKYVFDLLKYPELVFLDKFCYIPSILTFFLLQHTININNTLYLYVYPCILNNLVIFHFNVSFHSSKEKNKCMAIDTNISMKFLCIKLISFDSYKNFMLPGLFALILNKLVGESLHKTHHKNPKNIKTGDYDLVYYFIIRPLHKLNLIKIK